MLNDLLSDLVTLVVVTLGICYLLWLYYKILI